MELSLKQLFGDNAYQDIDRLVINKGDLFNLFGSSTNTAESLLLAIVLKAYINYEGYLTNSNNIKIVDANKTTVDYRINNYVLTDLFYWKRQYIIQPTYRKIEDVFVITVYELYTNGN